MKISTFNLNDDENRRTAKNIGGNLLPTMNFGTTLIDSPEDMAISISGFPWSPIVWNGSRRGENFTSAECVALDFDDGKFTIEAATELCLLYNLAHIIGTTKSHMVSKGNSGPCQRFRLVLFFDREIKISDEYKHNVFRMMRRFPDCDKACSDSARFFWPCKEIVSARTGFPISVQPFVKPIFNERKLDSSEYQTIPRWLMDRINNPPGEGQRNSWALSVCCSLMRRGFDDNVISHIIGSCGLGLPDKELASVIRSARNYQRGSFNCRGIDEKVKKK